MPESETVLIKQKKSSLVLQEFGEGEKGGGGGGRGFTKDSWKYWN
jgi:hypothetical protein